MSEEESTKQPAVDLLSGDEDAAVPSASTDADEAKKFSIDEDEDVDKLEGKIYQDIVNFICKYFKTHLSHE